MNEKYDGILGEIANSEIKWDASKTLTEAEKTDLINLSRRIDAWFLGLNAGQARLGKTVESIRQEEFDSCPPDVLYGVLAGTSEKNWSNRPAYFAAAAKQVEIIWGRGSLAE